MQKTLPFNKMHGLGNDFVILDFISHPSTQLPITTLADRHLGIGFDQLLCITSSKTADFGCQIFNADGSEAEQCGNGMRCIARYVHENKLTTARTFSIETKAGVVHAKIFDYDNIQINMGIPDFNVVLSNPCELVLLDKKTVPLTVLSMGNPHAILQVSTVKDFPVATIGPQISSHTFFPQGVNVGFLEVLNRDHIRLRTFERGSGETFACGSNACAAVVSGIMNGTLNKKVCVELAKGNLEIEWEGERHPVLMTGPAVHVFSGII